MGLLYEMVVKRKRSMKQSHHPVRQTEREERESNQWKVESIIIHGVDEQKEQNK